MRPSKELYGFKECHISCSAVSRKLCRSGICKSYKKDFLWWLKILWCKSRNKYLSYLFAGITNFQYI